MHKVEKWVLDLTRFNAFDLDLEDVRVAYICVRLFSLCNSCFVASRQI